MVPFIYKFVYGTLRSQCVCVRVSASVRAVRCSCLIANSSASSRPCSGSGKVSCKLGPGCCGITTLIGMEKIGDKEACTRKGTKLHVAALTIRGRKVSLFWWSFYSMLQL